MLDRHQTLCGQDIVLYGDNLRRIMSSLCRRIRGSLGDTAHDLRLDEACLFLDIPLKYRDQVENLFVVMRDADMPRVTSFGQHSAMAEAIKEGFRTSSRKIRVFALPETGQKLIALAEAKGVRLGEVVYEALLKAYVEVMGGGLQEPLVGNP